jgi:hypothetical protein
LPDAEVRRFGGEAHAERAGFVGFCPDGALNRVCALARSAQEVDARASFWSRARVKVQTPLRTWREGRMLTEPGWQVDIDLGLKRFFLPNRAKLPAPERQLGWEVELAHRPGLTPLPKRLFFRGSPVEF